MILNFDARMMYDILAQVNDDAQTMYDQEVWQYANDDRQKKINIIVKLIGSYMFHSESKITLYEKHYHRYSINKIF